MNHEKFAAATFCSRLIDFAELQDYTSFSSALEQVLEYVEYELDSVGEEFASEYVRVGRSIISSALDRAAEKCNRKNVIQYSNYYLNKRPSSLRFPSRQNE